MGAWGLGLFQSDHDYEIIADLSKEAGLPELEMKVKGPDVRLPPESTYEMIGLVVYGNARYVGRNPSADQINNGNNGGDPTNYSIYAEICSDPETVRKHLDSGVLTKMLAEQEVKMLSTGPDDGQKIDNAGPGYTFVLLGASAMTLGCKIPDHYKTAMRKVYTAVGLMDRALKQMDKALSGSKKYQDGKPYDFGSLGMHETMKKAVLTKRTNEMGVIGMNVAGPGTMFYNPPKGSRKGLDELKAKFVEAKYGVDECAACGAKEGKDGADLMNCGKCRARKYCCKECQMEHWALHKILCTAPKGGKGKENSKP